MYKFAVYFVVVLVFASCAQPQSNTKEILSSGIWRGALEIGSAEEIPFQFNLASQQGLYTCTFINGEEKIVSKDVALTGDSLIINMPVFNSCFFLSIQNNTTLEGYWQNFSRTPEYQLPFKAQYTNKTRFSSSENPRIEPLGSKEWEVTFKDDDGNTTPALGLFDFEETGRVCGTFATETGDFRYLEGSYIDSTLNLSCFDGSHAFLFRAKKQKDGALSGTFWSGKHWKESWTAIENPAFTLADPFSLTSLSVPESEIDFSFPNLNGDTISLSDKAFENKAVIIQVLGSWCPNCVDESLLFQKTYEKHKADGLEVVGLCFEASEDPKISRKRVQKFKDNLGIEYPLLIAGLASKSKATETLGFLDKVRSFPTSIYIDKSGKVQKIHTGFYGPGTGSYYEKYMDELEVLISEMIH